MFLNADIPRFYCYLRKEFLYDQRRHHGKFVRCCVFGLASLHGMALTFHAMTENGAQIARLPIQAFCWKKNAPRQTLECLELWDCFSYDVTVIEYEYLQGMRCQCLLKDKKAYAGEYLFTVDWCGTNDSEEPGEGGHKCAHILCLDNGNYAAQPNNRIFWSEPAFITKPFQKRPDYRTNTHIWKCENESKWMTEHTNRYFYDIKNGH